MDEREFTNKEMGKLKWVAEGMYYRFEAHKLPFIYQPSTKVLRQMTNTSLALGGLKSLSKEFSKQEIFLLQYPFMIKEAQLSSEIEGTRSTIAEIYKGKKVEEKDLEKRKDNEEIDNYREALEFALKDEDGIINERLIKIIHTILLKGVRGKNKTPGNYKEIQNGVGNREDTLDTAKFVPASPESTPELMFNLMEFINSPDYEPLFKIAIAHYQFETIHPFRDGNGRLGRLLIILQLCREGILPHPLLYISEYFNRNRDTYTDLLFGVSSKGNIDEWFFFFLKALEYQANQSLVLLNKLKDYKNFLQKEIHKISQSPNIHLLIESLFKQPIFTIKDVMEPLNITQPSAWSLIQKLKEWKIVKDLETVKNKKVYSAYKIIEIVEGNKN
jgi:Fic family protein